MKKSISVLMLALVLCFSFLLPAFADAAEPEVGSYVTFGHYEQDNNRENGAEPVEWLVLAVEDGKALLLSRYGLDASASGAWGGYWGWKDSVSRAFLKEKFIPAAFTAEELEQVQDTTVVTPDCWIRSGGPDTVDKVFLLSRAEMEQYLPEAESRVTEPTARAVANGAYKNTETGYCWWWLRNPERSAFNVTDVSHEGEMRANFGFVTIECIRPALWVSLDALQ